ncbi:MAG: hypothetical protein ACXV2C_03885, partial [Candidatus Bathyarchaeia archaeon]
LTGSMGAIADGYMAISESYTGTLYVLGKGKSQTTVTAPDTAVPLGTPLVIKGSVIDQSPAQPNTPCVSADSMSTQMEHIHRQLPIDGIWHNITLTGVPVTLTAVDSNGNYQAIGIVTSDGYYGTFSKTWTPPIQGDYKIIASFAGDDSYGSSGASTYVTVNAAQSTATQTPQNVQAAPDYTMTIIAAAIGIAIVVVISAIAIVLLLRKRQ